MPVSVGLFLVVKAFWVGEDHGVTLAGGRRVHKISIKPTSVFYQPAAAYAVVALSMLFFFPHYSPTAKSSKLTFEFPLDTLLCLFVSELSEVWEVR